MNISNEHTKQILALLQNCIFQKNDENIDEKTVSHLCKKNYETMYQLAKLLEVDIDNGFIHPVSLEYIVHRTEEEAITCSN